MHRERPLAERVFSRLLIVSLLAMQLPLATLARADDADEVLGNSDWGVANAVVKKNAVPLPKPRPAGADAAKGTDATPTGDTGKLDKSPSAAPAKKDDKSAKSPIALCDTDDGTESAKPGYGAPVAKWPSPNTPEFQRHVEAFIKDRAGMSVDNPSVNGVHKSFPGNQEARADLSPSIKARQRFFDVTYGVTKDGTIGSSTVAICETKVQLAQHLKAYTDQKQKETDTTACSGAFKQTYSLYKEAHKSYRHYTDVVDHFLKGYNGKMDGKDVKFPGLETEFLENRRKNLDNLNLYKPPVTEQRPVKVSDAAWKSLKAEYELLWGKGTADRASGDKQIDLTGFYSNTLLQTRKEKERAEEKASYFKKESETIEERAKKCGFDTGTAQVKPQLTAKSNAPTITGAIKPAKKPDSQVTTGASAPVRKPDDASHEPIPVTAVEHHRYSDDDPVDTSSGSPAPKPTTQTVQTPDDPVTPPAVPAQPSAAGQFLKNNWMWLAGGAVLAGGGFLYYKKYKRDQREKAFWQDDSNFLPAATSRTTTTTGTGTGAAGSHFNFVSSIAGPGGIGQSMGPIGIAVTDSNSVVQNVSGVITLSCATACSIGGGTSASLVNGQATFTGVTFSSADQNVLLQVSGAGLPRATAPSSFNVGGSTATNPRY